MCGCECCISAKSIHSSLLLLFLSGHQCLRFVRSMRWWYYNLGHLPLCIEALVSYHYNIIWSFCPTFPLYRVWIFVSTSFLMPPHPYMFLVKSLLFHLLPTSSPSAKLHPPGCCLPPATRQPPPLIPAPRAACLLLTPFLCRWAPPFAAIGLHPGPCRPLGGSPGRGPSTPMCTYLVFHEVSSNSWNIPVLGF